MPPLSLLPAANHPGRAPIPLPTGPIPDRRSKTIRIPVCCKNCAKPMVLVTGPHLDVVRGDEGLDAAHQGTRHMHCPAVACGHLGQEAGGLWKVGGGRIEVCVRARERERERERGGKGERGDL